MRHIPLRTVEAPGEAPIIYADAIRLVIRQPLNQQQGVSIEEMRSGIRILDKLDAAGDSDTLALEDADWTHLTLKVRAMTWGMVERRLLEFIDTVLNAPEVGPSNGLVPTTTAKEITA